MPLRPCSLLLCCLIPPLAHAAPADELLELINSYRASAPQCAGKARPPMPPLKADPALASLQLSGDLPAALRAAGYPAAKAEALTLSGPSTAAGAMQALRQSQCALLLDPAYPAVGIQREGVRWQIVLARPLLALDLGDWEAAGRKVLDHVNRARAQARRCGDRSFAPAPPLTWNQQLGQAALAHSNDMATHRYFSHQGRDGSDAARRAERAGYKWRRIGENIATGQGAPEQAVKGWLDSPGHCANLMQPEFSEMGAAYAINQDSETTIYWTQVFGAPR